MNQERARRVVRERLADRAEEKRPEPAEPSGADDEEVRLVRRVGQHLDGPSFACDTLDGYFWVLAENLVDHPIDEREPGEVRRCRRSCG